MEVSQKTELPYDGATPLPRCVSKRKKNANSKKYEHSNVHSNTIYHSEDVEVTQESINRLNSEDMMRVRIHTHTHTLSLSLSLSLWNTDAAAKSLQSCLTLCDPTDGSPPGSPVPGILQARTLEWVAISFSNA